MQRRNPLDAIEVGVQNDLALRQRGGAGVDDLLQGGLLLGWPLGDGEVVDEQAQVGEGLLSPVLQVEDAVTVIAVGESDGAGDDKHTGEVGGQVVMEAVGDIAAQLLNELGGDLLGTLRLPLHLLQAVFGVADQDSEGGGQDSPEHCPKCHGKEWYSRNELRQKECGELNEGEFGFSCCREVCDYDVCKNPCPHQARSCNVKDDEECDGENGYSDSPIFCVDVRKERECLKYFPDNYCTYVISEGDVGEGIQKDEGDDE